MKLLVLFFFAYLAAFPSFGNPSTIHPGQVAILFNSSDPESRDLAEFYAQMRSIPPSNLLGLPLSKSETITRATYEKTIRQPLVKIFNDRQWWTMGRDPQGTQLPTRAVIRTIAIMRGVPLRISRTKTVADKTKPQEAPAKNQGITNDEASVDSELTLLGVRNLKPAGMSVNRYYNTEKAFTQSPLPFQLLVGRIDAPTLSTCKRMVLDALDTETEGLWGRTYVDFSKKTGGYTEGDAWLDRIAARSIKSGHPTITDRQKNTFTTNYPMTDAALYFGWYAHHRNGPFLHPKLKMKKGSIIVHLHSFSAQQLKNPKKNWSAAILEKGAAATLGNVYEPYLKGTHHLDIFHDRLLKGYTLVEAAYMALPILSWQNIVLGDPLYRPYSTSSQTPKDLVNDREYKALRTAYQNWKDPEERTQKLRSAATKMQSGTIMEALGYDLLEIGKHAEAQAFFQAAKKHFKGRADQVRQDLNTIEILRRRGMKKEALAYIEQGKKTYQGMAEAKSLIGLSTILNPPPPKPAQPKKK